MGPAPCLILKQEENLPCAPVPGAVEITVRLWGVVALS